MERQDKERRLTNRLEQGVAGNIRTAAVDLRGIDHVGRHIFEGRSSDQAHIHLHLVFEHLNCLGRSLFTISAVSVNEGSADTDCLGLCIMLALDCQRSVLKSTDAKCDCFENISSAPDTSVNEDRESIAPEIAFLERIHHFHQNFNS